MNKEFLIQTERNKNLIGQVLDSFKIGHEEISVTTGPTVTLFEFKPSIGVRMSKVANLGREFAVALSVQSVRVIAPTERGTVGIEVPNVVRENVEMTRLLYCDEYISNDMELPLLLGKTVNGEVFIKDLSVMPHLLVAGATGMGKSVGLNVIISSLLNKRTPDELKLVLVDPKQVELSVYESIAKPYLAHLSGIEPISTTPIEAQQTLEAVIRLMESRYTLLSNNGVRNIQEYNAKTNTRLPYYVVIIDEYGDLILQGNKEMENAICRIAQKARAVGIHMIISTQRPDTKIVTGNIKANFPTRIAFRTTTGTDSRVIIDRIGAERLTGKGDMLFFNGGDSIRVQCAYISTEEVCKACEEMAEEWSETEQTFLPDNPTMQVVQIQEDNRRYVLDDTLAAAEKCIGKDYLPEIALQYLDGKLKWGAWNDLTELGIIGELTDYYVEGKFSPLKGYPVLVNTREGIASLIKNFKDIA